MLKMSTVVAIALCVLVASPVAAQQCTVSVYGDAQGTQSLVSPRVNEAFDLYVVTFIEGVMGGLGYTLVATDAQDLTSLGASFGPDGGGLNIPNDPNDVVFSGANVGLGVCAVGFGGFPLVVAKYSFVAFTSTREARFTLTGNVTSSDLDPSLPTFSDCQGNLTLCDVGPELIVEQPVDNDADSFSAVKSLFN